MTAISFAVVGSFEDAIDGWRNYSARHPGDNDGVILAATAGAVGIKLGGGANQNASSPKEGTPLEVTGRLSTDATFSQSPELAHLAVIVGLVWRTVVMWMVLLALLTLARLLG
jgi:adenosylcobinamide-phosphate synthase